MMEKKLIILVLFIGCAILSFSQTIVEPQTPAPVVKAADHIQPATNTDENINDAPESEVPAPSSINEVETTTPKTEATKEKSCKSVGFGMSAEKPVKRKETPKKEL